MRPVSLTGLSKKADCAALLMKRYRELTENN